MPQTNPPLSAVLPPLIFGTATFNHQYNVDPFKLPTTTLVHRALSHGIRAFDTSPYYGPSEELLGKALSASYHNTNMPFPRKDYAIITKVGRIAGSEFNYETTWVQKSVQRSLVRLNTSYLDVVYCHDVEFVSPAEVLTAVTELRRIRDVEGALKYVGISGYPVTVLCSLAEFILKETGQPLDCVLSYANFTLQNRRLETEGLDRLQATGVGVVLNASILGMGLLRRDGIPIGGAGDWHPAPNGLRQACRAASDYCHHRGERIETVAIRWALETWLSVGGRVGSCGSLARGLTAEVGGRKLGVSVMGVSSVEELDETVRVWQSVLDRFKQETAETEGWGNLATGVWQTLGEWQDFVWASPGEDYVRVRMSTDETTDE